MRSLYFRASRGLWPEPTAFRGHSNPVLSTLVLFPMHLLSLLATLLFPLLASLLVLPEAAISPIPKENDIAQLSPPNNQRDLTLSLSVPPNHITFQQNVARGIRMIKKTRYPTAEFLGAKVVPKPLSPPADPEALTFDLQIWFHVPSLGPRGLVFHAASSWGMWGYTERGDPPWQGALAFDWTDVQLDVVEAAMIIKGKGFVGPWVGVEVYQAPGDAEPHYAFEQQPGSAWPTYVIVGTKTKAVSTRNQFGLDLAGEGADVAIL